MKPLGQRVVLMLVEAGFEAIAEALQRRAERKRAERIAAERKRADDARSKAIHEHYADIDRRKPK